MAKSKPARQTKDDGGKDKRRHVPEFRGSFVHLARPHAVADGDPRFSMNVMLDPDNDEHMDFLDDLEEWIEEVACAHADFGGKVPKKFTNPIKEADVEFEDPGEFAGHFLFTAYKNADRGRPGILGPDREPMDEMDYDEELYSGAYYRATIRPWAWSHPTGGKGVSIALVNVMKTDDGERLGSLDPDAEDDFADVKTKDRPKSRARGRR